ncbi:peptide MFS transporter [Flavobacterium sp. MXW15]|uniref:Peptide MFS transporter n=1 Tax=Xanthomonas chitinilytica TaxID=2989819 RepID=A0ABT3JVJ4_9XANT|nr:peptide MFS transporter [Xanthomonas sp. H13-6]MCW4453413.1 peptide MFS transporter [Flavobacterium sp. MXW15]MCW4472234.1 peptide MFS transporter [Xanthomonas sp. H13-6]
MSASHPAAVAASGQFLGHPKGLYVCFLTEMWERFAFYGMKALLLLYLTKHHLFSDTDGYLLLGTYAGLAYALPLLGGLLADRYLGMRKAVVFGGILLVLGQLGMAYTGHAAAGVQGAGQQDAFAVQVMYFSLALIGVGVGFLKPNISTIVGRLYPDNDPRRDSGFTIFYMGINVGAFLSSLIVAYIGEKIGWGYGFALAGVMMALGLVQFLLGRRHLLGQAEPADPVLLRTPAFAGLSREMLIYLGGLLLTVVVWQVLQTRINFGPLSALFGGHEVTLTEVVAVVLGLGLYAWFVRLLFSGISRAEKGRMIMLMVLITVSALFWGLYEQTYGPWVAMADRAMDRTTFGIQWTAGQTTAIGALAVIALSPVFAWIWPRLDRLGLNPSYPAKFAWGLVFCGLAFGVLAFAAANPGDDMLVSLWWMILAYFVLVLGEMVLSPVGLAAVTSLSIPRAVGMMMGAWFLFSAFGEIIAGRLGTWAAIPHDASRELALSVYAGVFTKMMWIGLVAGALLFLATPLLKRLTRD